ncbi:hypothetical protein [Amycolatopsis anabasis]|uniref:hypothetical protein n=1 Tax=Amycolatopsis anabasis TaxID=1840409 RepID=UPI00131DB31A|nr:hypothetical protein [Amycolatopsis anabasis]
MGDGYTVNTDGLRTAATKHLDGLAADLETARGKVNATGEHEAAFTTGPGELFKFLAPRFEETTSYLNRVFLDNIDNLRLCSAALREIANRYDGNERSAQRGVGA